jgi:short-subunit dehydrogenase
MNAKNELVIITGASTGIGFELARFLSTKNYSIFACARKQKDLDQLKALSPNIIPFELDVTQQEHIGNARKALETLAPQYSKIHLINNAGIAVIGPIEALPLEEFRKQFEVNFFGVIAVTQAFLPFIRNTKGRIVNMSSVAGKTSSPFMGPYSSSKYALEALSDALRREVSNQGVKVVVIEPGPIATPIWDKGFSSRDEIVKKLNPETFPLYQRALEKFIAIVETISTKAIGVEHVSRAVETALCQSDPPTRILVADWSNALQNRIVRILPDKWVDRLMSGGRK